MAIRIKSLEKIAADKSLNDSIYRDLTLDIGLKRINNSNVLIYPTPVLGADIQISEDLAAIVNSLQNLFTTSKGQRVLFPEYGLNLRAYIFQPIVERTAALIGRTILEGIEKWETRVVVKRVNVIAEPDDNQYTIDIIIDIPVLNLKSVRTPFVFNMKSDSFTVVQENTNNNN